MSNIVMEINNDGNCHFKVFLCHTGHTDGRPLQPKSSVITDAKSPDLNLDDFARKMPESAWQFA